MHTEYQMIVNWSKKDNCYFAVVPDLRGCFADGKTRAECVRNTEVVIDEWLEDAKTMGWEIPKPSQPKDDKI